MAVLPSRCRKYLVDQGITFEEIDEAQKAIVLLNYPLPTGRFDAEKADLLIVLPSGYPDVRPDMFFAIPWLRLVNGAKYPRAADQPFAFAGKQWQQWSRHQDQWRPGIDGIWTMLRRVDIALETAA